MSEGAEKAPLKEVSLRFPDGAVGPAGGTEGVFDGNDGEGRCHPPRQLPPSSTTPSHLLCSARARREIRAVLAADAPRRLRATHPRATPERNRRSRPQGHRQEHRSDDAAQMAVRVEEEAGAVVLCALGLLQLSMQPPLDHDARPVDLGKQGLHDQTVHSPVTNTLPLLCLGPSVVLP